MISVALTGTVGSVNHFPPKGDKGYGLTRLRIAERKISAQEETTWHTVVLTGVLAKVANDRAEVGGELVALNGILRYFTTNGGKVIPQIIFSAKRGSTITFRRANKLVPTASNVNQAASETSTPKAVPTQRSYKDIVKANVAEDIKSQQDAVKPITPLSTEAPKPLVEPAPKAPVAPKSPDKAVQDSDDGLPDSFLAELAAFDSEYGDSVELQEL
jgi:hypothetical protein